MDHGHDHSSLCGDLCHLNESARSLFFDLVMADRFTEAEALRRDGIVPADKVLLPTAC